MLLLDMKWPIQDRLCVSLTMTLSRVSGQCAVCVTDTDSVSCDKTDMVLCDCVRTEVVVRVIRPPGLT